MNYLRKTAAAAAALMLLLCSCAERAPESKPEDKHAGITVTGSSTAGTKSAPKTTGQNISSEKFHEITAYAQSYIGGKLTFSYKGKLYTLPFERESFADSEEPQPHRLLISEQIISNRLGEEVKAKLLVNDDLSRVGSCDVISPNGRLFGTGSEISDVSRPPEDFDYSLHRSTGSQCELVNPDRVLYADLNDLPQTLKFGYSRDIPAVEISGYMFTDGKFILHDLKTEFTDTPEGRIFSRRTEDTSKLIAFFGTVESTGGGRVSLLLTDGVTVCVVPADFTDGAVSDGSRLMFTVCCGTELYGSGEHRVFDHAVIYTSPADYGIPTESFQSLAYARLSPDDPESFEVFLSTDVSPAG